jgi:hypothetical protein
LSHTFAQMILKITSTNEEYILLKRLFCNHSYNYKPNVRLFKSNAKHQLSIWGFKRSINTSILQWVYINFFKSHFQLLSWLNCVLMARLSSIILELRKILLFKLFNSQKYSFFNFQLFLHSWYGFKQILDFILFFISVLHSILVLILFNGIKWLSKINIYFKC